jgi:two-component system chemotaxis response regulator CheB
MVTPMSPRDMIVIGGSAGSFTALQQICSKLPADLPASVFIVLHVASNPPSALDRTVSAWGPLRATYPRDLEKVKSSHIYVAPPDFHLTLEDGSIRVLRGPRENRHRPAIDPLFRSAARIYHSRVIGVILSGRYDDGVAGLYAVKERGGIAIVQDPKEAAVSDMPQRALLYTAPHYVLRAKDIAPTLIRLVNRNESVRESMNEEAPATSIADESVEANLTAESPWDGTGFPSVFACPECHGVLWEQNENGMVRFRCRVGHYYGQDSLRKELSETSEAALWAAMRALEEKAALQHRIANSLMPGSSSAARLRDQSSADEQNARLIRDMIFSGGSESKLEKTDDPLEQTA